MITTVIRDINAAAMPAALLMAIGAAQAITRNERPEQEGGTRDGGGGFRTETRGREQHRFLPSQSQSRVVPPGQSPSL